MLTAAGWTGIAVMIPVLEMGSLELAVGTVLQPLNASRANGRRPSLGLMGEPRRLMCLSH